MYEQLVALRSSVAYAALGAVGIVTLLRVLISLEMRRMRTASPTLQPDLVQRVLNRHGDSGLGMSPRQKFQLAIERLSERGRRLTRLLVVLVVSTSALVAAGMLLSPKAPAGTAPSVASAATVALPIDSLAPAASERAPVSASSQASPSALVFTLLSVKVAPGAGDFTEFRLTTFVNGFRNSYPTKSAWADLKEPSLPVSFSVDLEKDYRIAFKGQLRSKNGSERAYTPPPVDVFEWRGRDEERVYASSAPLIIKYRISTPPKSGEGVAERSTSKKD